MMIDTDMTTTASRVLIEVLNTAPGNIHGMRNADNHRDELDALRSSEGAMMVMHGGEFREGPAYYVSRAGTLEEGRFIPTADSVYHDTTEDARRCALTWVAVNGR